MKPRHKRMALIAGSVLLLLRVAEPSAGGERAPGDGGEEQMLHGREAFAGVVFANDLQYYRRPRKLYPRANARTL